MRAAWDPKRGTPGFFISDPERIEQLAPDYDGWFAGVPVHINHLGFGDTREYSLTKRPNTFRILVLGDSVTFGHGSIYEHTYPRLLEERLKAWRPDREWEVWNLGVPGYNTSQELTTLLRFGPEYQPDLVVVGFFENDILDNPDPPTPSRFRRWRSDAVTLARRHIYSYDWYRRRLMLLRGRFMTSKAEAEMIMGIATQEAMLAKPDEVADLNAQQLMSPATVPTEARACPVTPPGFSRAAFEQTPGLSRWKDVVRQFGDLRRSGRYQVMFFINAAPDICQPQVDLFVPGSSKGRNDYLSEILSAAAPTVSSYDAFLAYHPSDVPGAGGHSLGNANAVKADVLFRFLTGSVLNALPARTGTPGL